jgi:predicted Zn finger-like uncharacterized protein
MSMVTQCPSCSTTYRVTPQQLQAQHGKVRCGRCATVFDGFNTLATIPDESVSGAEPQPAASARGEPTAVEVPAQPQIESGPAPATAVETSRAPTPHAPVAPAPPRAIAVPEPPPAFIAESFTAEPLPQRRSGGWAFGALLLLITLAAQAAYLYRGQIAARVPELRPYLDKMCVLMRCTVALPQDPLQISIEASDMQATDPAYPGLIALTATLRNQATIVLGYPALDVVLTNTKEHTVARRIFLPAEYLDAGKDPRAGIPPNAEITVRLNLNIGDLDAAGFRLERLAAPQRWAETP